MQALRCVVGAYPGRQTQPPRAQCAPGNAVQSASSVHRSPNSAPTAPTVAVVAVCEPNIVITFCMHADSIKIGGIFRKTSNFLNGSVPSHFTHMD